MEKYKILDVKWRSALHTVGFVAYDTGFNGQWNAVVGYCPEYHISGVLAIPLQKSPKDDAQYIAAHGAKLSWQEAAVFFPQLDIKKFKYHPDNIK